MPNCQQHALALVVARPVLVRLAEVAERDGSVDSGEHLTGRPRDIAFDLKKKK